MLLKGKNIVITGSGRGIGKEIAKAIAKEGANIGLNSNVPEEIEEVKKEIEDLGLGIKVIAKVADLTIYEEVEKIFKEFHDELGILDGIIANAGYSRMANSHEFDPNIFAQIVNINITGVYYTFRAAYPHLKLDDKNDKARFIVTGSAAFPNVMPKFAAYSASKYGAAGLVMSLAQEYKKENLTINSVLPTQVDTTLLRGRKAGDGNKPAHVMNPWDLNDYYIFLLTSEANRMNGELIYVNEIEDVRKLFDETPADKKESWNVFKDYLEEKSPKIFNNVKKHGKLIEYFLKK